MRTPTDRLSPFSEPLVPVKPMIASRAQVEQMGHWRFRYFRHCFLYYYWLIHSFLHTRTRLQVG